jgi:hypothetical protein
MKDRLMVVDDRSVYRIQWYLAEEGDMGATLGEGTVPKVATSPPGSDDWQHEIASIAAGASDGVSRDCRGFFWETRAAASSALKATKAAMKNQPLADWESKALAAGWKPPRGRL